MWIKTAGSLVVAIIAGGALLSGCSEVSAPGSEEAPPASAPQAGTGADATPAQPATVADLFPEGPGRDLVLNNCTACHAVACSVIGQRTATRWDSLREDHRDKVSSLSEQDVNTLFAYLKERFNDTRPEPTVPPAFLEGGCTPF